ncbi:MAG: hypothetical protein AAB875_02735 [Patescibacteria group bacterium]
MSERLITGLQELLFVSTKPLPDVPGLAEELHKSETEVVARRKSILNGFLGIVGNDKVWNLLFHASAMHSGEKDLERALLNSSQTITPESSILVNAFGGNSLTLIKSDKGAEWGEELDTNFPARQFTRMGLNFLRASERWLEILCKNKESFEKILTSLAGRFEEAARIPAKMESFAGDTAAAISENRKEIDMLTSLARSLEAAIIP